MTCALGVGKRGGVKAFVVTLDLDQRLIEPPVMGVHARSELRLALSRL